MTNHHLATGDLIHTPYRQVFADAAARAADATVYGAVDLFKKAYQVDTNTEYVLTGFSPTVWSGVGGGASNINWRGGTPGDFYNNANPAGVGLVAWGDTVMGFSGDSSNFGVTFPLANAASAGKDIAIIDSIDKQGGEDSGQVIITPAADDNFMSWPDNIVLSYSTGTGGNGRMGSIFRSDGNGTVWCVAQADMSVSTFSSE